MYVKMIININMKTIVEIMEQINLLESSPPPELGTGGKYPYVQDNTNMSTSDGRIDSLSGPASFPVYRSTSIETQPQQSPDGQIFQAANGFGISKTSHEMLAKIGKVYGVDVGPQPGSKEALNLLKQNPDKRLKNLYLLNNEIKHRERTSEIYQRLISFGIDLENNDIHKDYSNPENHGDFDNMELKTDLSQTTGESDNTDTGE